MSCSGCRVLRKGCSESCILRPCLLWIGTPEAQGHATVFVAKFFGRAALINFLSSVEEPHRPALFQSLLYEACGRTVNPVTGAVGLLWTGNWRACQEAVETVLRGGALRALPAATGEEEDEETSHRVLRAGTSVLAGALQPPDLELCLSPGARCPRTSSEDGSVTTNAGSEDAPPTRDPTLLDLFV